MIRISLLATKVDLKSLRNTIVTQIKKKGHKLFDFFDEKLIKINPTMN